MRADGHVRWVRRQVVFVKARRSDRGYLPTVTVFVVSRGLGDYVGPAADLALERVKGLLDQGGGLIAEDVYGGVPGLQGLSERSEALARGQGWRGQGVRRGAR